jgi:hypothetical protein
VLEERLVLAEALAVIGGHHDERAVAEAERVDRGEHPGDLLVGPADLGAVAPAIGLRVTLRAKHLIARQHAESVVSLCELERAIGESVVAWHLRADRLGRGEVRAMRVHEVEPEKERHRSGTARLELW